MTAVWLFFRAELRLRWQGWLAFALLVAVFAGVVEAAAAGARRTDSAYPRLLAWSSAPDCMVFSDPSRSQTFGSVPFSSVAKLPQVTRSAPLAFYTVAAPAAVQVVTPLDSQIPASFWHRKLLAGRLPDPRRASEADVSFTAAQALHLTVGESLRVTLLTSGNTSTSAWLQVVGIDAAPAEFPPQTGTGTEIVWATPAFYRTHRTGLAVFPGVALLLRHGAADVAAVQREVNGMVRGKLVQLYPLSTQSANTERSIHAQAVTLWVLAALLAAIGLLILGQLMTRQNLLESAGLGTLCALGMNRGQLLTVGLARAAVIGVWGAVAAAGLALAASPLLPIGLAHIAEPNPGFAVDAPVLLLGGICTVLATIGCAAWPAWKAAARAGIRPAAARPAGRRRQPARHLAGATPWSIPAVIGVRLALHRGTGRTSLPVRSTLAGAAVAVAALSAAIVFSASLGHLLTTPRLFGVTWDADVVRLGFAGPDGVSPAVGVVTGDRSVAVWALGYTGAPLATGSVQFGAIAMFPGHGGQLMPVPLEGRLPTRPDELAMGAQTLAAAGAHVGSTISVSLSGSAPRLFRVVGVAVFPTFDDTLQLGKGGVITVAGVRRLLPSGVPPPPVDTLLLRFRPGVAAQPAMNALAARLARAGPFAVSSPATPTDLVNFGRVQDLPLLLGTALSALALLTIVHLLLTSVRRRRHDLAILRTIGFTRGQVRQAVAWQAATLTACAVAIGVPVGIVCGRAAWQVFARQLGILPVIDIPVASLAVLALAALLLAVAVAALPGESAARARPAHVLRSE